MLEEDFYRTYSKYLKDIYGEKVYKLPVKLNLSCPNRDGNIRQMHASWCIDADWCCRCVIQFFR